MFPRIFRNIDMFAKIFNDISENILGTVLKLRRNDIDDILFKIVFGKSLNNLVQLNLSEVFTRNGFKHKLGNLIIN